MECNDTYTPEFDNEEPCEQVSASCVILEQAIAYLGLPADTPMDEVIIALLLSLQDVRSRTTQTENVTALKYLEDGDNLDDITERGTWVAPWTISIGGKPSLITYDEPITVEVVSYEPTSDANDQVYKQVYTGVYSYRTFSRVGSTNSSGDISWGDWVSDESVYNISNTNGNVEFSYYGGGDPLELSLNTELLIITGSTHTVPDGVSAVILENECSVQIPQAELFSGRDEGREIRLIFRDGGTINRAYYDNTGTRITSGTQVNGNILLKSNVDGTSGDWYQIN